jgi:hypothetical protein
MRIIFTVLNINKVTSAQIVIPPMFDGLDGVGGNYEGIIDVYMPLYPFLVV